MLITIKHRFLLLLLCLIFLAGCDERAWNNPYPNQKADANIVYASFNGAPKHLDPAIAYNAGEWQFISQIYEQVVEYNYLLRPYTLQPLTAEAMPKVSYDAKKNITTYKITIKPGIMYQPHPAFARDAAGNYYYHALAKAEIAQYNSIQDFKHTGTRELTAADYIYQIKRLADPSLNSPVYGVFSSYIHGLTELHTNLLAAYAHEHQNTSIDLRNYELSGVELLDKYTYTIKIIGKYPQFKYWLEMPFFAPIPWEATQFYAQDGMAQKNLSLDTSPIGTGAFYLTENNPTHRMVLQRNPHFHKDLYPAVGMPGDAELGLLANANKPMPFVDAIIFNLEKESTPRWDKFMQGYYDYSAISAENFNSAISSISNSQIALSPVLVNKGIRLAVDNTLSIFYWGFNMLDETVGGYDQRGRKLRQAISLAIDVKEFISIFLNGRALVANSPLPAGIEGYVPSKPQNANENLLQAKQLLAEAGYANGIDPKTMQPLQIYYDAIIIGGADENARLGWTIKQFAKLGINLVIRSSDYNRFQDKMHNGTVQFFQIGWNADYPDPENFLFLFYSKNSAVNHDGMNKINYNNPEFDKLFEEFKNLDSGAKRLKLIQDMIAILQTDAPWVWGVFPQIYGLYNKWYAPTKPNSISTNTAKYVAVNPEMRAELRVAWNKPLVWPVIIGLLLAGIIILPAIIMYLKNMHANAARLK